MLPNGFIRKGIVRLNIYITAKKFSTSTFVYTSSLNTTCVKSVIPLNHYLRQITDNTEWI